MQENDALSLGDNEEMPKEGPFDTFLNDAAAQQQGRLRTSNHLASKMPPQDAADALRLSIRTGLPIDTVFRQLPRVKVVDGRLTELDLQSLSQSAPKTADWASNPYNMAAGRDDLERLAQTEQLLAEMAKPKFKPSTDQELETLVGPTARKKAAEDFAKQTSDPMDPAMQMEVSGLRSGKRPLAEIEKEYVSSAVAAARRKEAFLQGDTSRTSFLGRAQEAFATGGTAGIGTNELGRLGMRRVFGEDSPELRAAIADTSKRMEQTPQGSDFASRWLYPTAKIVAQMVDSADKALERGAQGAIFGAGLGAFGGPAAPLTVPAGFASGFGVGMTFGMGEQAFITEGGNAYVELDQIRGKNGEQLDETTKRGAAIGVGVLNAALEMVGLKLVTAPFKSALKKQFGEGVKEAIIKPTMKRAFMEIGKEFVGATVGEAGTEVAQEAVNVLAEEMSKAISSGEFQKTSPAEVVERLVSIASETLRGSVLLAGVGGAAHVSGHMKQLKRAKQTEEILKKIADIHKQIELAADNPQEVEKIAKAVVDQVGMPYVTVAAAPVAEFYKKAGVDPSARIAELTGSAEEFNQAVPNKGDFQIPTEKYLAMSPEEKTFFQSEIRRDPGDMTVSETETLMEESRKKAEAQAQQTISSEVVKPIAQRAAAAEGIAPGEPIPAHIVDATADEAFQKAAKSALSDAEKDAALQKAIETRAAKRATMESVQRVADEIKTALEAAGFRKEAGIYAKQVAAAFKTLGEREKIDPYKLFSERPLTVERTGDVAVTPEGQVYQQPGEAAQPPRGRIKLGDAGIKIDLLTKADATTFLHETGHLYLDLLGRLATREAASDQIKADWQAVKDWLGTKEDTLTTEQHEKWAAGFERYLMEGKAPSKALRGAFYRFKEWLAEVYRGAKEALGIELNDDIRKVMDRILATDEEILQAQFDQAQAPLFEDAKSAGATDAQASRYAELTLKARQLAEEKLLQKAMEQARREQTDWYKAEREKVRAEVEDAVNGEPLYRAVSMLQKNETPAGVKLITPGLKIDRASMGHVFGGEDVDVKTFPRGITSQTEGTHVDIVAGMFRFEDGRTFMHALQGMEDRKAKIDRVTDERMLAEYGGEPTEADFKEAAQAAIHNDARAEQIMLEMQILARGDPKMLRLIAGGMPRMDIVRKEAQRAVGRQTLKTINPKVYASAERRAANAAITAHIAGDDAEAIKQKKNEIANHEGYVAADAAKEDVKDSLDRWKILNRSDERLSKAHDMDFVNAARAILASVNIGKVEKSASSYLESLKQYDPQLHADMVALVQEVVPEANRELADLTYDEFKALKTGVDAMIEMSTRANQISVGLMKEHIKDVIEKLTKELDAIAPAKKSVATHTKGEEAAGTLIQARAGFTRVEHWAQAIGEYFEKVFPQKIHEGTDAYRVFIDEWLKKYEAIVKELPKLKSGEIHSTDLNFTFKGGKKELIGALLHTGNREDGGSNFYKLLLGREWGTLDQDGILDSSKWDKFIDKMQKDGILTKADYDFVQKVWDLFEELKPQLQQTHKAMNGYHFNPITATPFHTPWGEYKGGYFPALADPTEVEAAAVRSEQAAAEVGNSFSLPTAGTGRTKNRSKGYWKPLRMDVGMIQEHIRWAGKYIHIEPHIAELRKIMWNREFRDRLKQFNPAAATGIIMPWLQRTATQTVEQRMPAGWSWLGKVARWLKQTAGAKQIGLNVVNSVQNYEGLAVALTKVNPGSMVQAAGSYLASPRETHQAIAELSDYMKHRTQEVVGSLQDTADEILHDAGIWKNLKRLTMKHVYFLSKLTQGMVDDIVWKAAFNDAIANGKEQDAAIKQADSIVRTTQGSGAAEDISAFEAGNAAVRLFTMYTSWFNMRANLLGSEGMKILRRETGLGKKSAKLMLLTATGFTIPALVAGMIYHVMSGKDLDPDDDGYLDDIVKFFFGSQFQEAKAMAPGVGPVIEMMANKFDKNAHNDELKVSPGFNILEQIASTPADIYKAVAGEDRYGQPIKGAKGQAVDDVLTVLGGLTGIPAGAIAKQAKYATNVAEGSRKPTSTYDLIRGVVTGKGSTPNKK